MISLHKEIVLQGEKHPVVFLWLLILISTHYDDVRKGEGLGIQELGSSAYMSVSGKQR